MPCRSKKGRQRHIYNDTRPIYGGEMLPYFPGFPVNMQPYNAVEFFTFDGVKLRGDLYLPQEENVPIVIMTHGLTLTKEQNLQQFAEKFQRNGIAVLVYDHRGYGESEGSPRNETNIMQQVEDSHDAVSYVRTLRPAIDPNKIAIWGIGHSGGMSIIAAALDPRIAAALIIMPWVSGSKERPLMPMQGVWANRETGTTDYIRPWPETEDEALNGSTFLSGKDVWRFITSSRAKSRARNIAKPFVNKLSLQSFYHISKLEPRDYIHLIAPKPLLYSVARVDGLTGSVMWHESVFDRAGEPKQIQVMENEHLATYEPERENFEANTDVWVEFVKKHLGCSKD